MTRLAREYVLPAPSQDEGLSYLDKNGNLARYEATAGPAVVDLAGEEEIEHDYGVIVKAPNPWNPRSTVVVLYGASTHGTAAAAEYFVGQRQWLRRGRFTALVGVDVRAGYNGKPVLCDMHRLNPRR